jgi:transcriptional regulator with XRE-family HTH domain
MASDAPLGARRMVVALRQMLQEADVSQYTIADRMKVSQSAVAQWRKGYPIPKQDKVDRFASTFGIRDEYFGDPALGDAPDYRAFLGRKGARIERIDGHPVLEDFIAEQRLHQAEADDLRSQARAWGGRFVRDELLLLLPAVRARAARLRAEAAGEPDPAPREPPPVPEGRRRVPPGKKGR